MVLFSAIMSFTNVAEDETKFDQLAPGKETQIYRATYIGSPIHCAEISDGAECLDGWKEKGSLPVTLWLGNSQLHAINQMKPGDVNGVQLLHDKLYPNGGDLIAFSEPNASLQEHYLLFEYLKSLLPIKTLLLPVVFDDTRENGIRNGLLPALDSQDVMASLSKTKIGLEIMAENIAIKSDGDLAGLNDTPQKVVESTITGWLSEHWALWEARLEMRGQLFKSLYMWRNSILGINAQSKRKAIPGRYLKNLASLEAILLESTEERIHVILYVVPLRNDVETPYVAKEYARFKKDVENLAKKNGAVFANLEMLVPGEL